MPSTLDNEFAESISKNIFTSSDYKERPITMSITQSASFGSTQLPNMDSDGGPELTISLSASSDSLGFGENVDDLSMNDMKAPFDSDPKDPEIRNTVHPGEGHANHNNCEVSVASTNTKESNQGSQGSKSNHSATSSRPGYEPYNGQHFNPSHGYQPPPFGPSPPHYHPQHPHYQRPYYSGPNGQYSGNPSQPYDPRFQHGGPPPGPSGPPGPPGHHHSNGPHPHLNQGMPYQPQSYHHNPYQHNYPPPHGYRHGPPPPHPSNSSSNQRHFPPPHNNSSTMSVSSNGSSSRKRAIDSVDDDSHFLVHRSSSNSSTCSIGTAGNNTSSETFNQMICESPMKRERTLSPKVDDNERRNSTDSGSSVLSFGGLNMGNKEKGNNPQVEIGKTPVSKNTTDRRKTDASFNFESESENHKQRFTPNALREEQTLNRQLRDQSFTPIHPNEIKSEKSASPTFDGQLAIEPQLSWSIAGDPSAIGDLEDWPNDKDEDSSSPMSFAGNISPMLFNIPPANDSKSDQNGCNAEDKNDDDIMQMGVLSPSMEETVFDGKSTPLPFSSNYSGPNDYSKPNDRNRGSPQPIEKHKQKHSMPQHSQHYRGPDQRIQGPSYLSPQKPMSSMGTPQPYHHQNNPPTPYDRREECFPPRGMHSGPRDGPPQPPPHHMPSNYQSPRGMYPGHINGEDRVRNLRGRGPGALPPSLHLPHHIPSHAFLTSPIGATPRGGMMPLSSPLQRIGSHNYPHSPHLNASKRRCVPLKPPIPSKFQGDMEKAKNAKIPDFTSLVNFPAHMSQKQASMIPDGMRCCVMCGHACPCTSVKNKKGAKKASDNGEQINSRKGTNSSYAIIPTQNKGLCTQCDVNVWVVMNNNLEIKWCKGCKNFRPWAAFGEKGLATKCVRCRERQREKYAAQKEEKDNKKKSHTKPKVPLKQG